MNTDALKNNPHITPAALSEIHADLLRWARSLAGEQGEDVLQQSYLLMLEGKAKYERQAELKTWAFGVVKNVSKNATRGSIRQRIRDRNWFVVSTETQPPMGESIQGAEHREQQQQRVKAAIGALPQRQREVLELHTFRDFTLEECAHILSLSVGSVRTHYHRAKATLRNQLAELV